MEEFLNNVYNLIIDIINNTQVFGPLFACLLIFLESILPILPLFVFITIIFISYGYVYGFILSYLLTCLGCLFSFFIFRKLFKNNFNKYFRKTKKLDKLMKIIDNIKLSNIVLLMAIPFTPAFLINIAAGLSNISYKKYIIALLIGKISLIIFWGFIGTGLLESLKNPKIMLIIGIMLIIAFIISKICSKKLNVE